MNDVEKGNNNVHECAQVTLCEDNQVNSLLLGLNSLKVYQYNNTLPLWQTVLQSSHYHHNIDLNASGALVLI